MMSSTFKILFYIRKNYLNRDKKAPLMIRVTINGKMVQFNSKLDIEPQYWNPKKQRAEGSGKQIKMFNTLLENIKYSLQNHFHEIVCEEIPTPEKVRDSFLGVADKENTLMLLFKRHLDNLKNIVGKGMAQATYDKYDITYRRLKEFMKSRYNLSDIPLRDIKNIFVVDFENFLIQTYDYGKNTRAKFLQRFHSVILIARRNNWIKTDPFDNFVIGSQKVDRGYLTQAEVDAIWNKELNVTRLEKARDAFIFACYTGLAYVDVCHLKKANIVTINGEKWIRTRRQKTDTLVEVPLLKIPERIIEKYKGYILPDDALIPISSNQKVNAYLKEIADLCGIQKNLTYHLARHTFATTITLSKGVSMESVSKMLGHTKITTTQIYARILNSKVKEEMKLVETALKNGV
ncbi:MAG: site-specific integrase [Odoribacter sp.]|nr:site-specific integrase [Odoribacter sp.]